MLWKFVGSALVLVGTIGTGWKVAAVYRERMKLLQEIRKLLQLVYGEIEYAASDLGEIFRKVSKSCPSLCPFLLATQEALSQCQSGSLADIWKEKSVQIRGFCFLKQEEKELLWETGCNLGNLDRQSQLHTLAIFMKRLDLCLEQTQQESGGKIRVCHVLAVTAGIFTVVLLI